MNAVPAVSFRFRAGTSSSAPATGISISGRTVTLTLASAVTHGQTVEMQYTRQAGAIIKPGIQDPSGNLSPNIPFGDDKSAVTNNTPPAGISSATVDGLKVTVTLTGNRSGCPALQAWTIDIDGTDFKPGSLRCETSSVLLWLHEHTAPGSAQTYKVSYDKTKAAHRFATGVVIGSALTVGTTEVASFTDQAVTNPNPGPRYRPPGPVPPAPHLFYPPTVNGKTLTFRFVRPMDENSVPAGSAFKVTTWHGGGPGIRRCMGPCTFGASEVSISGRVVTLTLEEAIPHGADMLLVYTPPSANPLRRASDGTPAGVFRFGVTVETPDTAPVFSRAQLAPPGRDQDHTRYLYIEFNEVLDASSRPAASAFTVTAKPRGGRARTIAGTGTVNIHGSMVLMELAEPVASGKETVTVSYVKPSANPLRDRAGKPAESFSGKPVPNGAPWIEAVSLSSDPGPDRTYGRGEKIRVQVTFSEPVSVTGTPRHKLSQGRSHPEEEKRVPPTTPEGGPTSPGRTTRAAAGRRR